MICQVPGCGGALRVSHTHTIDQARTQRVVCQRCGMLYTTITVVQEYTGRGTGARAVAAKLMRQLEEGRAPAPRGGDP
jgi:hypothetical protein